MRDEDLFRDYPELYHMAEAGSWPSIARHGLMSATALLDRCRTGPAERRAIESRIRPEGVEIGCGRMGRVVIRDQKPLKERTLARLLPSSMSVAQYCRLLNERTFLWADEGRLKAMLNARAYRGRSHDVLTVDTRSLVARHRGEITLSRINSGATSRGRGERGRGTFKRIGDYPYAPARAHGGNRVVEVAVDYMIKDIRRFVVRVEERRGDETVRRLWKRGERIGPPGGDRARRGRRRG